MIEALRARGSARRCSTWRGSNPAGLAAVGPRQRTDQPALRLHLRHRERHAGRAVPQKLQQFRSGAPMRNLFRADRGYDDEARRFAH